MNVFIRAMVRIFSIFSPHENILTIALINIHYLYTICYPLRGLEKSRGCMGKKVTLKEEMRERGRKLTIHGRVYFKKRLELHILGMLRSITCLTGGSKDV
jgi:hypothetical protein